jgi:tetratricopeptide (TPR) repeat protein
MKKHAFVVAALLPLFLACTDQADVLARYRLEQKLWRAQFYQRRINISVVHASQNDTRYAIAAFDSVLTDNPLSSPKAASWRPEVVADIKRIHLLSRVALASLFFLSERYTDAGKMYERTLEAGDASLATSLDARLGAARSMYLAGESTEVMRQCAEIFQEISTSEDFWSGRFAPDPVFVDIPVVLTRLYRESGDVAAYDEFRRTAGDFYSRVVTTWPGTPIAWQAALGQVQLRLVDQDWQGAVVLIDGVLAEADPKQDVDGLRLLQGEIYAFALHDPTPAMAVFDEVETRAPNSALAYAARYDRAALLQERGDEDGAMAAFRVLEQDQATPGDVAARAMFARASLLEKRGSWDEALQLLRRMQQIYPHAPASIEAPILVTRHYVATGDGPGRAHARARARLLSVADRSKIARTPGTAFESRMRWPRATSRRAAPRCEGCGSPGIGSVVVGRRQRRGRPAQECRGVRHGPARHDTRVRNAQKCIERFPETRYSRLAQLRLDEIEGRRGASSPLTDGSLAACIRALVGRVWRRNCLVAAADARQRSGP